MAMGDQPGDPHYEAELAKALNEAKLKGLPDSWTVKLDLVSNETVNEQQTAMPLAACRGCCSTVVTCGNDSKHCL